MNARETAKASGLRLDKVLSDTFHVRHGQNVMAVISRSDRGASAWVNPKYDVGSARIARDANGWQYVGRASTLAGIVRRITSMPFGY